MIDGCRRMLRAAQRTQSHLAYQKGHIGEAAPRRIAEMMLDRGVHDSAPRSCAPVLVQQRYSSTGTSPPISDAPVDAAPSPNQCWAPARLRRWHPRRYLCDTHVRGPPSFFGAPGFVTCPGFLLLLPLAGARIE